MSTDNIWRVGMVIENRELAAGTKLIGRHRKELHHCDVVETDDGIRYRLDDGRSFTSLSSAAKAVMSGVSVNGWRFWSLADAATAPTPATEPSVGTSRKAVRQLMKLPNQKGVNEVRE
jgi:F420-0:gamma-glutamyl ligase-like protein